MTYAQPPRDKRSPGCESIRSGVVAALTVLLSMTAAEAQTTAQQAAKKPAAPAPAALKPQAATNNPFNLFGGANNSTAHTSTLSPQAQKFLNPNGNTTTAAPNNVGTKNPLASFLNPGAKVKPSLNVANNPRPVASGPQVPAKSVPGYPAPPGSKEMQGHNGSIIRTASDGSIMDVRNPSKGMVIHHAIDGSRRVVVQQPDGSRAYIPARGIAYVQHPYTFHGKQLDSRTFVVGGQTLHQIYRPYTYAGNSLDVYATSRYFAPNFYQWVSSKAAAPSKFVWPYNASTPWYGHYQGYFTPDTAYQSPTQWLTDYMLAVTLYVAYATKNQASDPPPANTAPVTPQVKQMLNDEVARQVRQESSEASDNSQNRDPPAGAGSVVQELSDRQTHVFLVSSDLDLADPTGRRCALSEGDVVQVTSAPKPDSGALDAIVLASKGGVECGRAAQVEIALNDVQEMQNHMRATLDQGMASTPAANLSPSQTPPFAAAAPPPDQNAPKEIEQQTEIAAAAES